MHFWIDKRQAWERRGCGKIVGPTMVTPVHRFQAVEAVVARSHHNHHRFQHNHQPRHLTSIPNVGSTGHHYQSHHQRVVAHPGDIDGFLDATHHHLACHPVAGGPSLAAARLKCGMWASFSLVAFFMVVARFYFGTESVGLVVLVFCILLVVVLLAGCAVSLCEAVAQPTPPQAAVVSTAHTVVSFPSLPPTSPPAASSSSSPPAGHSSATTSTHSPGGLAAAEQSTGGFVAPPPPYHIAVLLPPPPPQGGPPSPPPTYDKAVCVS